MTYLLLKYSLQVLKRIALFKQFGNPFKESPKLEDNISPEHNLFKLVQSSNYISVWQFENAICTGQYGGAIIDANNKVYSQLISFPWGKELHPTLSSPYLGRRIKNLDKAIFLITPEVEGNYYHWVCDLLPRIALIKKSGLSDFGDRYIILHDSMRDYETESLALIGVEAEKILRLKHSEIVAVKNVVTTDFVSNTHFFPLWKKDLLKELINTAIEPALKKPTKLYLLRGRQKKRNLIGEGDLVRALEKIGFTILDPSKLSFVQQIQAFANAQVVVGLHGAGLANIVFCKQTTIIVELRSSFKPPEFYSQIASVYNLTFKTVSIHPVKTSKSIHIANKQDLVLEDKTFDLIVSQLQSL